jgi:single-strand DNA-binding protein
MSAYFNKTVLIGRVGKDPIILKTNDGQKIAKFSLATTDNWMDKKTNERVERTEWHRICVFSNKVAEIIEQYVKSGSMVLVEGKIKYNKWVDPKGVEVKLTDIVIDAGGNFRILDSKSKSEGSQASAPQPQFDNDIEDDLPF